MSPSNIEDLFAFAFMAWSSEEGGEEVAARLGGSNDALTGVSSFQAEVERLRFDVNGAWRISQVGVFIGLLSVLTLSLLHIVYTQQLLFTSVRWSQESVQILVTRLWAGQLGGCDLVPPRDKRVFSCPLCADWFWSLFPRGSDSQCMKLMFACIYH
jgi:hypothetical protein